VLRTGDGRSQNPLTSRNKVAPAVRKKQATERVSDRNPKGGDACHTFAGDGWLRAQHESAAPALPGDAKRP
jgi:hypothetical protein